MLHVLPPENQACLATNQVAARCEKLLQKLERSSTYCKKSVHVARFTGPSETCFAVPVWRQSRTIFFNQKSVFPHLQQPDLLRERLERGL